MRHDPGRAPTAPTVARNQPFLDSGANDNDREGEKTVSALIEEILTANRSYQSSFGNKRELAVAPKRRLAILTCMDARLAPLQFAGLVEGDAHVIRNAGGRASEDAIRSLVISYKLLGTREWLVIHHTGCGLTTLNDDRLAQLLESSLETARFDGANWLDTGAGPGSSEGQYINWMTIADPKRCLIDDVRRLRNHPLVPPVITIYGFMYDVATGALLEDAEASTVGRARAQA